MIGETADPPGALLTFPKCQSLPHSRVQGHRCRSQSPVGPRDTAQHRHTIATAVEPAALVSLAVSIRSSSSVHAPGLGRGRTCRSLLNAIAPDRSTLRPVFRNTSRSSAVCDGSALACAFGSGPSSGMEIALSQTWPSLGVPKGGAGLLERLLPLCIRQGIGIESGDL